MALLLNNSLTGPQTHVLIIGVGGYPYLEGGTLQQADMETPFQSLGQLTSVPVSATAFLDAILAIEAEGAWLSPLGTINVLINQPGGDPVNTSLGFAESPTLRNIENAYLDWRNRCDENPNNVAIFYFCGHGIQKGDHHLLAEDFMERIRNPAAGAFNFSGTRRGFMNCRAEKKLFFIDACRDIPYDAQIRDFTPLALDSQNFMDIPSHYSFLQQSTLPSAGAFSRPGKVSIYTKALIQALRGQVAQNDAGDGWMINTAKIAEKMNTLMLMHGEMDSGEQACTHDFSSDWDIIRYELPPDVDINVISVPSELQQHIRYACYSSGNDSMMESREPAPSNWEFTLKAGHYRILAISETHMLDKTQHFAATPPKTVQKIRFQ